jgi:diketogulonate reductase-like aldo/keto reductase
MVQRYRNKSEIHGVIRDKFVIIDVRQVGVHMKYRRFGAVGHEVAVIGQGTWYLDEADHAAAIIALRRGLELGMNHIDTAELYGDGAAEALVGEAIEGRRDEVFLVSKVLPENATRTGTIEACERSLRHLRTDRLDCYLLHWRGSVPLEETVLAFDQLSRAGKILSWGVSNFDVDDLEELRGIAGDRRIACNQVLYHLQERAVEHAVIPWCERHAVAITAYSPFAHGRFPTLRSAAGRVLVDIAKAHDATARQVALAFLTRRPGVFAIPKASDAIHAEENAAAGDLRLSMQEVASIEAAFPLDARPRELPML